MNNILEFIDRFSFKQIISSLVLLTLVIFLPFGFWFNTQTHTYKSRASLEPTAFPTPIGQSILPKAQPIINQVIPFYGKVGDEIIIKGTNFGENPANSKLLLGNIEVDQIISWENEEIRFTIPSQAISSALFMQIGQWQAEWDKPISIYSSPEQPEVSIEYGHLQINNAQNISKIEVWEKDLDKPAKEYKFEEPLNVDSWLSPDRIESLAWLILYDKNHNIIPFWSSDVLVDYIVITPSK